MKNGYAFGDIIYRWALCPATYICYDPTILNASDFLTQEIDRFAAREISKCRTNWN